MKQEHLSSILIRVYTHQANPSNTKITSKNNKNNNFKGKKKQQHEIIHQKIPNFEFSFCDSSPPNKSHFKKNLKRENTKKIHTHFKIKKRKNTHIYSNIYLIKIATTSKKKS